MLKCIGILQFSLELLTSKNVVLKSYISISKLDLFLLLSSIFLGEQLFYSKQHNSQKKKVKATKKTCQTIWSDWNSGWRRGCWRELCASARLTLLNSRWTSEVAVVVPQIPFHGSLWFLIGLESVFSSPPSCPGTFALLWVYWACVWGSYKNRVTCPRAQLSGVCCAVLHVYIEKHAYIGMLKLKGQLRCLSLIANFFVGGPWEIVFLS